MALTLSAYARDAATLEGASAAADEPRMSGLETFASASASAAVDAGVEIPGSPERTANETPRPRSVDPSSEYVFGRRRTWTRAPEAPEDHRGTPRAARLPPRLSLPPSLVYVDASSGEAGTTEGSDNPRRRPAAHVPPLDFRAVLRDAEQRSRTHARVRDASTRAAAARGYGEYVDGSTGFASKEAGAETRGVKGGRRGFTTGHDEPARGSDLEGRGVGGFGGVGGVGATDGARFLRAGEADGDGCAPSERSSDLSSDDVSDASGAGDAEVWSAPPERLREALTDPGGGGGARGELRRAARRDGPGLDVAVARVSGAPPRRRKCAMRRMARRT